MTVLVCKVFLLTCENYKLFCIYYFNIYKFCFNQTKFLFLIVKDCVEITESFCHNMLSTCPVFMKVQINQRKGEIFSYYYHAYQTKAI